MRAYGNNGKIANTISLANQLSDVGGGGALVLLHLIDRSYSSSCSSSCVGYSSIGDDGSNSLQTRIPPFVKRIESAFAASSDSNGPN
jgi:hypothetical protein